MRQRFVLWLVLLLGLVSARAMAQTQINISSTGIVGKAAELVGPITLCNLGEAPRGITTLGHSFGCAPLGSGSITALPTPVDNQLAVWTTATQLEGVPALTYNAGVLAVGVPGATLGKFTVAGSSGGAVTIQPQANAGTYNFILPDTAGANGQVLTSGGGGITPMTWATPAGGGDITSVGDCGNGPCDVVGNFIVKPMVTALSGTPITLNLTITRYAEIATVTGPTVFNNPTGTSYNKDKITYHVCSAAPQPLNFSGSEFRFRDGLPAPVASTGGGTCDLFLFERDLAAAKWDLIASTQNSESSRRSQCVIALGLDNDTALSDPLMQRWKACRIPKTALIEQISIEAMPATGGITPSVLVHRRTGTTNTALLSGSLTTAASGGLACARVAAETGLEGVGCSALLVSGQVTLPGGDIVLGVTSGSASGASSVLITVYYLKTS